MTPGAKVAAGGGWRSAFECFLLKRDMAGWEWEEYNEEEDGMKEKNKEKQGDYGTKRGSAHGRVLLYWTAVLFLTSAVSRSRRLLACILMCIPVRMTKHITAPYLSSLKRINMNPKKKNVDQINYLPPHTRMQAMTTCEGR